MHRGHYTGSPSPSNQLGRVTWWRVPSCENISTCSCQVEKAWQQWPPAVHEVHPTLCPPTWPAAMSVPVFKSTMGSRVRWLAAASSSGAACTHILQSLPQPSQRGMASWQRHHARCHVSSQKAESSGGKVPCTRPTPAASFLPATCWHGACMHACPTANAGQIVGGHPSQFQSHPPLGVTMASHPMRHLGCLDVECGSPGRGPPQPGSSLLCSLFRGNEVFVNRPKKTAPQYVEVHSS